MRQSPTKKEELPERRDDLLRSCPPGSTLHTVLRHVSRSGMYRAIDVYRLHDQDADWLSYRVAALLGMRFDKRHEAIGIGGCGMDMGFAIVSDLSRALYPEGFGCIGEHCPSNDHSNGDRDRTPHVVAEARPCPAHPRTTPEGGRVCANDETHTEPLTVLYNRNSWGAFYVCSACRAAMLESSPWIDETPPECRTCDGSGQLPAGHWHRAGDYAIRQRWL